MIAINYDGGQKMLFVTQMNHAVFGTFTMGITKEDFESQAGVNATPYEVVAFEPYQNLFMVKNWNEDAAYFADASGHAALTWLNTNQDAIAANTLAEYAADNNYVDDGSGNYVPEKEMMDVPTLKAALIKDVRINAFSYAAVILNLSTIGSLTGLSINSQVNNRLNGIRTWMNDHETAINALNTQAALLAYVVDELDVQAEDDINTVMGML